MSEPSGASSDRVESSPVPPPAGGWPPLRQAVEAARGGDGSVLGEILTAGYPRLVAFYRGMGASWPDAEDLASEACEGVVRNLARLREPGAFEAWFWTIARNRFRSRLRKKGRVERELEHPAWATPDEVVVAADEHHDIRRALTSLSQRDREILWLSEVEGLSHDEVGGRLGLAGGAARVAALRARRRLLVAYQRLQPDSE